jgi:hypothetical protein
MKSIATIVAIVALTALPVNAQRGMAGGGFAGHSAPMGHGGFSGPVSSGFRAPSGSFAYRPPVMGHPLPAGNSGFRPVYRPGGTYHYPGHGPGPAPRPPYRPIYHRHNIFITSVVPSFVNPFFWGFPGWGGWGFSDNSDDPPSNSNNGQQAPAQDNGSGDAPLMPSSFTQSQRMPYTSFSAQSTPAEQNPVTLIFRDGSAPKQVHNYMMTTKSLWVLDQTYQEIPLDQIDIAATVAKNRAAGIDFHVPDASN